MSVELGKANYDGNRKKTFKIIDGDNVYRILPPMKSLAKLGYWSKYYSVVWGYENAGGKKRPFNDCRKTNFKTRAVEVESAAYLKSAKINAMLDELKLKKKNGEAVDPETLDRVTKLAKRYNIEGKHYVNAVNLKGEIGVLKIGAKAKQGIEAETKKLLAKGIDPLSIENGRYFNIYREGTGLQTMYQVTVYKEQREVGGELAEFDKVHAMDANFIARLGAEASDLGSLYVSPTPDQIKSIVEGADPDVVLGANAASEAPAADDDIPGDEGQDAGPSAAELAASAALEAKKASDAKLAAEAKKAKDDADALAAKKAAEASDLKGAETPANPGASATSQSDADWLKSMGI